MSRIALLHPQCRIQGGAIKMALLSAQSLQRQGHDVTLYTFDHSSECFSDLQEGIYIEDWGNDSKNPSKIDKKTAFFLPRKLFRMISLAYHVRHVDTIVANNPPMHIVAALAKIFSLNLRMTKGRQGGNEGMGDYKMSYLTTIWWHHHTPWYLSKKMKEGRNEGMKSEMKESISGIGKKIHHLRHYLHYSLSSLITRGKSCLERYCIIPFIDQMVATSHFVAGQIKDYCGREAQVIHPVIDSGLELTLNGLASGNESLDSLESNIGNPLNVSNLSNVVLFTHGRLEPGKGLDTIVTLWKRVESGLKAAQSPDSVHLLIAGSGSLAEWLREQGAEVIPFDRDKTFESMKHGFNTVVAVYASTIDAFGMAPLEAQMSGLPTVILDRGGARETILTDMSGNPVGHLVQSEEEIYASICHFIEHKLFPKPVSIVNFSSTIQHFTPSRLDRDLRMLISKTEQ